MAVTGEQGLRAIFLSSTGVTGIVASRVYPHDAPQESGILAYGTYFRVSSRHAHDLNRTKSNSGFVHRRIQMDWFSDSYDTVVTLEDEARLVADGFLGNIAVGSTGIVFGSCILEDDATFSDAPLPGKGTSVHQASQDWMIGFAEVTS